MKRCFLLFLICMSCIVVFGCEKTRKNSEQGNEPTVSGDMPGDVNVDVPQIRGERVIFYRGETFTEESMMYPEGTRALECIFSTESRQTIPYCFDPGCEHHPPKISEDGTEVLEEGCPAYDYSQQSVFVQNGYLYFFLDGTLYQADTTGKNRRIISSLSKPYTLSTGNCYYTEDALYVPYFLYNELVLKEGGKEPEWLLGEVKEKQEAGILRIPFSGEGESIIFRSEEYYDLQVVSLWRHDGCICFQVTGRDCPYSVIQEEAGNDFQAMMDVDRKHSFTEAYDYVIETGEIKSFAYEKPSHGGFYFFRDVYGVIRDSNKLELYRYSGERMAETEVPFSGVISDQYVIGYNLENSKGVLLNQVDGKVVKTSPFTWDDFLLEVVVGDSYYGYVGMTRAYVSAEDYWSGNKEGIVLFPAISVTQ